MKDKKYEITHILNYKKQLNYKKKNEYASKYIDLMNNFLLYTIENIHIQNRQYYLFVIKRGLETFSHVFKFLLLYTKNIDLTIHHCKKSFFYYIEFIGQIGDDNHTYLQLNSKDATLFVYKKTIFEIDNKKKKNHKSPEKEKKFMKNLTLIIDIYNRYILFFLQKNNFTTTRKEVIMNNCVFNLKKLFSKIISRKGGDINCEKLATFLYFFKTLTAKDSKIENIIHILDIFCKKNIKLEITTNKIRNRMYSKNCALYMKHYTPLKFVNWLFN